MLLHTEKIIKGDNLPSVSLFSNYRYGRPGINLLKNDWMGYWTAGVRLQWSLFEQRSVRARLQQTEAAIGRLIHEREAQERQVQQQIKDLLLRLDQIREEMGLFDAALVQANEDYQETEARHNEGMATAKEVLDAEGEVTRIRLGQIGAGIDYQLTLNDLNYSTGNQPR